MPIVHLDKAISMEATAAIVASIVIIIEIVHGLSKLLCVLDLGYDYFSCSKGRSWRVHTVVDIVRSVRNIVEHVTAEVLQTLLSEVSFALHDK